jgi:integrase/recombinase XerC
MLTDFINTLNSAKTRENYRRDVQRFLDWYDGELGALRAADVLEFIGFLQEEGLQAVSINRSLSALRSFIRWAALVGLVTPEVYTHAQLVKGVPAPAKVPAPLFPEEIDLLLAQPDRSTLAGVRDYAFLLFLLSTGCRLAEALALDVEDIRFDARGGQVTVWGKGNKERSVFFDVDTADALRSYLQTRGAPEHGSLFANEKGGRISHRWMQRALEAYGQRCGIDVHPHKLRRTFAVLALDATEGDLNTVKLLLGHESVATTQKYVSMATSRLRRVSEMAAQLRKTPVAVAIGGE